VYNISYTNHVRSAAVSKEISACRSSHIAEDLHQSAWRSEHLGATLI